MASNDIQAIAIGGQDRPWFGTYAGVSQFDGTAWTTYEPGNSGPAISDVWAIAIDGLDRVMVRLLWKRQRLRRLRLDYD